jgi:arylamine N-acetyltransferase
MLNVPAYLDRIAYTGPLVPTADVLRDLHRAHLFTVPFENLDIALGRKIVCDENGFVQKIVEQRRGGFCYELNGAFAALLRAIGFEVTLLSARVPREDGTDGPEFDHLALRIDLGESWLADVGFEWGKARIHCTWREQSAMGSGSGNMLSLWRREASTIFPACATTTRARRSRRLREKACAPGLRQREELPSPTAG